MKVERKSLALVDEYVRVACKRIRDGQMKRMYGDKGEYNEKER